VAELMSTFLAENKLDWVPSNHPGDAGRHADIRDGKKTAMAVPVIKQKEARGIKIRGIPA
jgi:hypothetical protein